LSEQIRCVTQNIQQVNNYLQQYTDLRWVGPDYVGPVKVGKDANGIITDFWGVRRCEVSYGSGFYEEICHYPLNDLQDISELEHYKWPSAKWFNFDNIVENIRAQNSDNEYAIVARYW